MNPADAQNVLPHAWPATPLVGFENPAPLTSSPVIEVELHKGVTMTARLMAIDPTGGISLIPARSQPGAAVVTTKIGRAALRVTLLQPIAANEGPSKKGEPVPQPRSIRIVWGTKRARDVQAVAWLTRAEGSYTYEYEASARTLRMHFWPQATIQGEEFNPSCNAVRWEPTATDEGSGLVDAASMPTAPDAMIKLPEATLEAAQPTRITRTLGELEQALDEQSAQQSLRIGAVLVGMGFVSDADVQEAIEMQRESGDSRQLGEILVAMGKMGRDQLVAGLAYKQGHPYIDLKNFQPTSAAIKRIPVAFARKRMALPISFHRNRLIIAVPDPAAPGLQDELKFTASTRVVLIGAAREALVAAIEAAYNGGGIAVGAAMFATGEHSDGLRNVLATLNTEGGEEGDEAADVAAAENSSDPMVKLINSIILEARDTGASDIHIECPPSPGEVQVRFRRDGVLYPYLRVAHRHHATLVARLKVMCDLDISEKRKPQDGKIKFDRFVPGNKLELRVATIPTANGLEDVVLRLLASARALPLEQLAFAPDILNKLRGAIERPYGMVLCVGPTGSGKTTTLHAALGHLNRPDRKVWTAEDPVEITQSGLRQVQVNPKIEWTFAKALRAFLRADPDVIMVGEIRDAETAHMAVEASLTGHLVLSTLHTNSAAETITRLLDMGMDPFSFADSLLGVLAQRLVRRLCKSCVRSVEAEPEYVERLANEFLSARPQGIEELDKGRLIDEWRRDHGTDGRLMRFHSTGCAHCGMTGLSGRVGLHELLTVNAELRHSIQIRETAGMIKREAMRHGMRTLRQDGILKVLDGLTTIEEVRSMSNE